MAPELAKTLIESVRRRIAQEDCPTEPALSVEQLEHLVEYLADGTRDVESTRTDLVKLARQVRAWFDADKAEPYSARTQRRVEDIEWAAKQEMDRLSALMLERHE